MFDLGWSEILVIAVVAILVVGPKDLPRLMKTAGEWMGKARRMASHFQAGVDEMIRQAELEDLRKELNTIRRDLNTPVTMDPRTTTTPPLPGPVEGPIAPPAPLAAVEAGPTILPPKAANE